jgi:TonB family protein
MSFVVLTALGMDAQPSSPQNSTVAPLSIFTRVFDSKTPGLILPIAIQKPSPPYTIQAMRNRVQGAISLEVTVDAAGRVRDALITKAAAEAFGLDEAAVAATSKWVFELGRLNGVAVATRTVVDFEMALH